MKVEALTHVDQLEAIAPAWNALARQDGRNGFFRTHTWFRAWCRHIRADAEPYVLAATDSSGRLVGLAPLCRLQYRDAGLRVRTVAWAGREVVSGDFLDIVAERTAAPEVAQRMLQHVWADRDWSLLLLGELDAHSPTYAASRAMAEQRGARVREQETRVCPFIALPSTFDEYLATLGSSTRYHIRRRLRDVSRNGAHITVYRDPASLVTRLETLIRLHRLRWGRDGQPGTLVRPGFAAFLRDVFTHLPDGAGAALYELAREDRPVASLLTFSFGDTVFYYQAGWDPRSEEAALSPGVVLMARSIQDAIADGHRFYEFLRGDETYKSRWTATVRRTTTVLVARGAAARGLLRVAAIKDAVKAMARLRRHVHPAAPLQQPTTEES